MVKWFLGKNVLFVFLGEKKHNMYTKKQQSVQLCQIYFTWIALTIFSFRCFFTNGKIQDGGQYFRHIGWHHWPPAPQPIIYSSSCKAHQRLSTRGKISPKYLRGGVPSTPPPAPCTTVGVWLCLYVRRLILLLRNLLCFHNNSAIFPRIKLHFSYAGNPEFDVYNQS